jgi:hypothetical protein
MYTLPCQKVLTPPPRKVRGHKLTGIDRLKCNRELPCHNCTVRSESASCRYNTGNAAVGAKRNPGIEADLQRRVNRLENLVTSLAAGERPQNISDTGDSNDKADAREEAGEGGGKMKTSGVMSINAEQQSVYKGSTHWKDVLDEVGITSRLSCSRQS